MGVPAVLAQKLKKTALDNVEHGDRVVGELGNAQSSDEVGDYESESDCGSDDEDDNDLDLDLAFVEV